MPSRTAEILVCGGGAAGMAAALAAARLGAQVELLEQTDAVGGTMAFSLLHTLAGLYGSDGTLLNTGLVEELIERLSAASGGESKRRRMGRVYVQTVDPNQYRAVVQAWLAEESNLTISTSTLVSQPRLHGGKIGAMTVTTGAGREEIRPRAVVDATGSADVFRALGPEYLQPAGPAVAGGFVFRLRGVDPSATKFPRSVGVARQLAEGVASGDLPAECDRAWVDVGIFEDEAFVKLFVQDAEAQEVAQRMPELAERITSYLRQVDGFADAHVTQLGEVGIRENGRARGEYCLTEGDVRGGARFVDAACRCSWPIEHWEAGRGLTLEYLDDGVSYDIPLRSLKAAGVANLWVAGRCLSAEPKAQASARCVGTCWAMGEAVGRAAATHVRGETEGRDGSC